MHFIKKGSLTFGAFMVLSLPMAASFASIGNNQSLPEQSISHNLYLSFVQEQDTQSENLLVDFDSLKTGDYFVQFKTKIVVSDLVGHAGFIEKVDDNHVRVLESRVSTGVDYRRDETGTIIDYDETSFTQALIDEEYMILRAKKSDGSDADGQQAFDFAKQYLGTPYDFVFDKYDDQKMYCSELVWVAFKEQGIDLDKYPLLPLPSIIVPYELIDDDAYVLYDFHDFK